MRMSRRGFTSSGRWVLHVLMVILWKMHKISLMFLVDYAESWLSGVKRGYFCYLSTLGKARGCGHMSIAGKHCHIQSR